MNDFQTMIDYYPFLVEYCIEFKRYSRKYLADLKGNSQTMLSNAIFITLVNALIYCSDVDGLGNF